MNQVVQESLNWLRCTLLPGKLEADGADYVRFVLLEKLKLELSLFPLNIAWQRLPAGNASRAPRPDEARKCQARSHGDNLRHSRRLSGPPGNMGGGGGSSRQGARPETQGGGGRLLPLARSSQFVFHETGGEEGVEEKEGVGIEYSVRSVVHHEILREASLATSGRFNRYEIFDLLQARETVESDVRSGGGVCVCGCVAVWLQSATWRAPLALFCVSLDPFLLISSANANLRSCEDSNLNSEPFYTSWPGANQTRRH
ncbi:hypothetical protein RRG08_020491 [Elysia crispata]|uniref:Uncharacterized protein n=1 Tax=Elysia crispata TaxID=231223 RepID=A0AAE0ZGF2_9GAST|nr:hypothetical protein RRG08_020491 [Elysia crispata]